MKSKRFLIFLLSICMLFSSCEKMPNMTELLAYEHEHVRLTLKIKDQTDFSVTLLLSPEKDEILFHDEKFSGIRASFSDDGKVHLTYEDYKIPLPSSSLLKALRWKELFHLSEKNLLWKIQKETLGGISVYTCKADDVIVYIDAGTYLPLKITQRDLTIDILESENLSPVIPKE